MGVWRSRTLGPLPSSDYRRTASADFQLLCKINSTLAPYPPLIGRFAKAGGATRYALNSSLGASPTGNFYLRTKAEAEQGIIDQGFASTTIVRPSLIDAEREQSRPAEHLGVLFARALKPVIPKKFRAVTPQQIAQALLRGVLAGEPGVHVVESDAL